MKSLKVILAISLMGAMILSSCSSKYNAGDVIPGTTSAKVDSVSYAIGAYFGGMIKGSNFGELNKSEMLKAMDDMIEGSEMRFDDQEIMVIIQDYLMKRQNYVAEKNLAEGAEYMKKNKEKEGVVTTESGLQYKIIDQGAGVAPTAVDTVEVHYKGTLLDGTVFDSSYDRGEPVKFPLNGVIPGWSEGLTYVNEGGKIELVIPAILGYGVRSYGNIPGNSTLLFEVELLKVFPAASEK